MWLGEARHQKPAKPEGGPGRTVAARGEAASEAVSDEATLARLAQTDCGAIDLLEQALARENMTRAWKRVKANKGSAGVDARTVQDTGEYLRELRKLGASVDLAARIAGNARRWWRNSRMGLNMLMPIAYFDRLGVPRFS